LIHASGESAVKSSLLPVSILVLATLSACNTADEAPKEQPEAVEAAASGGEAAVKPSFDCAKAEAEAEKMVCADPALARLDNEVARLYGLAEADKNLNAAAKAELTTIQRGWVKGRDDCWKADDKKFCLLASYGMRAHELRQGYANARSDDPNALSLGPVVFKCDGIDAPLGITFFTVEPGYAYLQNGTTSVMFAAVPDAPDARYAGKDADGGDYVLVTAGNSASFTRPGSTEAKCQMDEIG
jgi:uncharacterized protein YecT (DUF1311 family)